MLVGDGFEPGGRVRAVGPGFEHGQVAHEGVGGGAVARRPSRLRSRRRVEVRRPGRRPAWQRPSRTWLPNGARGQLPGASHVPQPITSANRPSDGDVRRGESCPPGHSCTTADRSMPPRASHLPSRTRNRVSAFRFAGDVPAMRATLGSARQDSHEHTNRELTKVELRYEQGAFALVRSQLEEATQMLAEPDSRLPSEQRATVRADLALAHSCDPARLQPECIAGQASLSLTLVLRCTAASAPG